MDELTLQKYLRGESGEFCRRLAENELRKQGRDQASVEQVLNLRDLDRCDAATLRSWWRLIGKELNRRKLVADLECSCADPRPGDRIERQTIKRWLKGEESGADS